MGSWGRQKPPLGTQIDWAHPLANGLAFALLINDNGTGTGLGIVRDIAGGRIGTGVGNVSKRFGSRGPAVQFTASDAGTYIDIPYANVPTSAVTVSAGYQKLDSTNRTSNLFAVNTPSVATSRFNVHLPWNDGTVYFDFGGTSAPQRLSVAGLGSTVLTDQNIWSFSAGALGMAIWRNGSNVSRSSSAASPRTNTGITSLRLGAQSTVGGSSDIARYDFFYIHDRQLSDSAIAWLNAEPYAFMRGPQPYRKYFVPASTGTSVTVNATALTGTYSLPSPAVATGVTVTPSVLTGTYSMPSPIVSAGIIINAPVLGGTFTLNQPDVYKGVTLAAPVLTGMYSIPTPSVVIFTPSTATLSRMYISLNL